MHLAVSLRSDRLSGATVPNHPWHCDGRGAYECPATTWTDQYQRRQRPVADTPIEQRSAAMLLNGIETRSVSGGDDVVVLHRGTHRQLVCVADIPACSHTRMAAATTVTMMLRGRGTGPTLPPTLPVAILPPRTHPHGPSISPFMHTK